MLNTQIPEPIHPRWQIVHVATSAGFCFEYIRNRQHATRSDLRTAVLEDRCTYGSVLMLFRFLETEKEARTFPKSPCLPVKRLWLHCLDGYRDIPLKQTVRPSASQDRLQYKTLYIGREQLHNWNYEPYMRQNVSNDEIDVMGLRQLSRRM